MASCKNRAKPRAGLLGCAEITFNNTLITPLEVYFKGSVGFDFKGTVAPKIDIPPLGAAGTLVVENYDGLTAALIGRAIPIQTVRNQSETAWFFNNLGTGSECCDDNEGSSGGTDSSVIFVLNDLQEAQEAANLGLLDVGRLLYNASTGSLKVWTGTEFNATVSENTDGECCPYETDGGFAESTYLSTQNVEGGFSESVTSVDRKLQGGDAYGKCYSD